MRALAAPPAASSQTLRALGKSRGPFSRLLRHSSPLHPGRPPKLQGAGPHHPPSGFTHRSGDSAQLELTHSRCSPRGALQLGAAIRKGC